MEDLEKLKTEYTSVIESILKDNTKFFQFKRDVEWKYIYNEDKGVIASCGKDLVLRINIVAIDFMTRVNEPLTLEFYILHEIRHLYQRLCIYSYKQDPKNSICNQAEQWLFEFDNYISMYKNREAYYYQSIEFDAYSFSYAVMLYKYGKIDYIFAPRIYDDDDLFYDVVKKWLTHFEINKY